MFESHGFKTTLNGVIFRVRIKVMKDVKSSTTRWYVLHNVGPPVVEVRLLQFKDRVLHTQKLVCSCCSIMLQCLAVALAEIQRPKTLMLQDKTSSSRNLGVNNANSASSHDVRVFTLLQRVVAVYCYCRKVACEGLVGPVATGLVQLRGLSCERAPQKWAQFKYPCPT